MIDLGKAMPRPEIIGDKPAPGVAFSPSIDGFKIIAGGKALYNFDPKEKILTGLGLSLPEVQLGQGWIRVGASQFVTGTIAEIGVGIAVDEDHIGIGAPLPPALTALVA